MEISAMEIHKKHSERKVKSRRAFLKSAAALSSLPFLPYNLTIFPPARRFSRLIHPKTDGEGKSIIGGYGSWAEGIVESPPLLSFRSPEWTNINNWRQKALAKTHELIAAPMLGEKIPDVKLKTRYEYDGLTVEELEWQLPYGRPTEAILLKPADTTGPLPAVLGLHDHGGNKYFGKRKITKTSDEMHPNMISHQAKSYSGLAWANELAKRGYIVLVHDAFTFGSRRVWYKDIAGITWGNCNVEDKTDENPEDTENIEIYNQWAAEHEHIMAKSLFCAGTTWPGVTLVEDQKALDILCTMPDVDANNIGCCGLSGGGLRTDYLGGLDHRIKCAVSVGFMSTWKDFLLNKTYTHTWMTYTPLLSRYLDFPEILSLRAPLPTMVLNDIDDSLYTMPEMKKADEILKEIFSKAGAGDKYTGKFYPGPHKFDAEMQQDAFGWFDRWLQ
jgi:dienelactone hydrolase